MREKRFKWRALAVGNRHRIVPCDKQLPDFVDGAAWAHATPQAKPVFLDVLGKQVAITSLKPKSDKFEIRAIGDAPGREPIQLEPVDNVVTAIFSTDGRFIATGSYSGEVTVRHIATGKRLFHWMFPSPVRHLAIAPDGRHVAVLTQHGGVLILRLPETGKK